MSKIPDWALGPHSDIEEGVIVRLNDDKTIDEVIISVPAKFHLEQMDRDKYWMVLSWEENGHEREQHITLTAKGGRIFPIVYR